MQWEKFVYDNLMCVVWTVFMGANVFQNCGNLPFDLTNELADLAASVILQSAALRLSSCLNSKILKLTTDKIGFIIYWSEMRTWTLLNMSPLVIPWLFSRQSSRVWLTFSWEAVKIGKKIKGKNMTESVFSHQNSFIAPQQRFTKSLTSTGRMKHLSSKTYSLIWCSGTGTFVPCRAAPS